MFPEHILRTQSLSGGGGMGDIQNTGGIKAQDPKPALSKGRLTILTCLQRPTDLQGSWKRKMSWRGQCL